MGAGIYSSTDAGIVWIVTQCRAMLSLRTWEPVHFPGDVGVSDGSEFAHQERFTSTKTIVRPCT